MGGYGVGALAQHINRPCYICGKRPARSLDHVFPQLLFPKGSEFTDLPPRLPACLECNNRLSQDEELFQQFLMSWRGPDTEQGRMLYRTKAGPRLRSPRGSGLRRRLLEHAQFAPLVDEVGRVLGTWPVMAVPKDVLDRVSLPASRSMFATRVRTRRSGTRSCCQRYSPKPSAPWSAPRTFSRIDARSRPTTHWHPSLGLSSTAGTSSA